MHRQPRVADNDSLGSTDAPFDHWLQRLGDNFPEIAASLQPLDIGSDEQYLLKRSALSLELQAQADQIRYEILRDLIPLNDPFLLANIVPSTQTDVRLDDLPLSPRCSNVLEREGVATVADLAQYSLDGTLRDWRNFGRKSAAELAGRIRQQIERRNVGAPDTESPAEIVSEPLLISLANELRELAERNARIIAARLGVGEPPCTLETIARRYGLTRQRIDQIVSRWLKSTRKRPWRREVGERIETLFVSRREPLYLDLLDSEDPWFAGWDEALNLGNAIELLTDDRFTTLSVSGLNVITQLSRLTWARLPGQAIRYLKTLGPALTESETRLAIEGFADAHGAGYLGELLYLSVRDRLQFATQSGETTLSSIGGGLIHHVKAVLDAAERPLHYTEIATRCAERTGRPTRAAAVHNFLPSAGAKYYGRGQWAQARHFELSEDRRRDLVREAEAIVQAGETDRQCHVDELLAEIHQRSPALVEGIDKYILNYALESSTALVPKGRLVWSTKADGARRRIDVGAACEQFVQEKGRPMSRAELIAEMKQHRGLGRHLNIGPKSRLLRISPGTWGFLERDFWLSEAEAANVRDRIYSQLIATGKSLREVDLRNFASGIEAAQLTPYMLMTIAQVDPRFRLQGGRRLGLAAWAT